MAERRLPMRMWVPGLAALMLGLAGCASSPGHVQVVDRNGHTTESAPRQPVRSGEYVVIPAQSSGAARARSSPCGMRRTNSSRTTICLA